MEPTTYLVPLSADGTIDELRLGRAHAVATCTVADGEVRDWTEHVVDWDTSYGVVVNGPHHTRLVRFVHDHGVGTIVAGEVCDSVRRVLDHLGVEVHTGSSGDPRSAILGTAPVG